MVNEETSSASPVAGRVVVGDPAPLPLRAPAEDEIVAGWGEDHAPTVSIICATYQHVEFIADALNGFLSQVTDFPFEVFVRDDASTDGTAEIVADFARRYPRIIRAVLETENTWPEKRAAFLLQPQARGEFVAFCEGDDYWPSPHHLSTLVSALRDRPEASAVFSPTVFVQDGTVIRWFEIDEDLSDRLKIPHFPGIPLGALCVRNFHVDEPPMQHRISSLDRYHLSVWASRGVLQPVKCAAPTVYRMHEGGVWSLRSARDRATRVVDSYAWIADWWRSQGDTALAREFERAAILRLASVLPQAEIVVRTRRFPGLRPFIWKLSAHVKRRLPRLHAMAVRALGKAPQNP